MKKCGVDMNAAKQDGFTAFMGAAHRRHKATVLALVNECGANVNGAGAGVRG